jgi:Holliday junction resolvase
VTDKKVKEKWVKQQVVKMLKDRGAYYFYPVASGYMSIGVPDIVACYKSMFIGIECKAGTNKPSVLQEKNLQHIQDNEGLAMVVNEDNLLAFQNFLDEMDKWK